MLALVAVAANATTTSQIEADANTLLAVRTTIGRLMSAGTVWAGLAVLSGWLVRRPVQAFAAGVIALLAALVVHYGVGLLLGMFDPNVWTENPEWVMAAAVLGGPLGLVGATARRSDLWGVLARLVVPAAAVLEPFVIGMFTSPAIMPWPQRVASVVSGLVLLTAGTAGCLRILVAGRKLQSTRGRRASPPPRREMPRLQRGGVSDRKAPRRVRPQASRSVPGSGSPEAVMRLQPRRPRLHEAGWGLVGEGA